MTAYMRKTQEVEYFWFALATILAIFHRKTAKFNETRFVRVQGQAEFTQPCTQFS